MGYLGAVVAAALAGLICHPFSDALQPTNLVMVFLAAVVTSGYLWGRGPATLASVLSVLLFDFFYVPPYLTLHVADKEYLVTFLSLMVVGWVVSTLTSRAQEQARQATALYHLSRDLAETHDEAEIQAVLERHQKAELSDQVREAMENQARLARERARVEDAERQSELLAASEALQKALLNSVSHDLRIPLVSITGALTALLEEGVYEDRETRQCLLENARGEADRLNRLVSNLLSLTRLETGSVKVEKVPVDLEDLISSTLPVLPLPHVDLALEGDLPLVPGDFVLLQQVLINLLDNAVKYSPEGSPLEIGARRLGDRVELWVADRGPGIPPGEPIFERFHRAADTRASGSGLGLSICQGLVEAHGGTIGAEPRPGGGSVFRLSLPLA